MIPVKGYEGIYSITEDGKVWSHRKNKFIQPKIYGEMTSLAYRLYKNCIGQVISISTLLKTHFPKELDEYKYINGFEGKYGVSKDGRVWSYKNDKELVTKPSTTSPYLYVGMSENGESFHRSVHRLVASTYIPNPDNLPEVDHIDRDIYNNSVENLRWATRTMNLENTEIQFKRHLRPCKLFHESKYVNYFESIAEAVRFAHENFHVSFSGLRRNLKSGECEIKV